LRGYLTALVLFHHTAITYGAIGGWYYRELTPASSVGSLPFRVERNNLNSQRPARTGDRAGA